MIHHLCHAPNLVHLCSSDTCSSACPQLACTAFLELQLPPKVYDLAPPAAHGRSFGSTRSRDGEGSGPSRSVSAAVGRDIDYKRGGENYKQRIDRLRAALSQGFFTGKRAEHRTLMQASPSRGIEPRTLRAHSAHSAQFSRCCVLARARHAALYPSE